MKSLPVTLCSALALLACGGEPVNLNSHMELGEPGRGVPGYFLDVNRAAIDTVRAAPDRLYTPRTVSGGNPGQCLMIPGYRGVSHYQLELADILLTRDGEVEISFDAKVGPDEGGTLHKLSSFTIDFRLFPDNDRDSYYPMLKSFSFRPTTEWRHFSRRFPVKAYTNYYNIWVMPSAVKSGGTLNSLYLDNVQLRYVDGRKTGEPEEYCVIPDRDDQLYRRGDTVRFTVRARLADAADSLDAELAVLRDYNNSELAALPLRLIRGADGTWTGSASWKAGEYGSFTTVLRRKGKPLRGINTSIQVLHPAVTHPFGSFGWGIGVNDEALCPIGRAEREGQENYSIRHSSFEREYRLLKESGVNLFRVWGRWRLIEPEKDEFTSKIIGLQMDMLKKYQIEPLFCLVGNFTVHGGQETLDRYRTKSIRGSQLPMYLYEYFYQAPGRKMGSVLPPMEIYDRYLQFVWKNWGGQVRCWEMSNEPGIFGMPAKNYIDYLKHTWKFLKQRRPDSILLGNGVTGDFGMNVVKWCELLNAADPNYVDYLDAVAFHPYACGLDYINGALNLYAQCVKNIQSTLAKPRPLWNTECYYLPTARRRQINCGREFSRYSSNELQRHFLDGFFHGVKASPSPCASSFFQRADRIVNLVPMTELAAAMNALSFLLTGMETLAPVDLGSQIRAGIFTDKSGTEALGFLYDLRPSGSRWTPGPGRARVLDLYGNERSGRSHELSFEPYFLTGTPAEVKTMLTGSTFQVENPVELYGRRCGDRLFLEARNRTGIPGIVEGRIGDLPVRFSFGREEFSLIELPAAKEVPANVHLVPETPAHTLPATVTLSRGTRADLSLENGCLKIVLEVADPHRKAAKGHALWEGSAVELFLDPAPFRHLDRNEIKPWQYAFAVRPSTTGVTVYASRNPATAATRKVTETDTGYKMEILLPLAELPASPVYGLDIEIDRVGEKLKESLGSDPGNSYRRRLHYHLIRLPGGELPPNGDFARVSFGDPANWCYPVPSGTRVDCAPEYGRNGNGLRIRTTKPVPEKVTITQTVPVEPGKYARGTLQVLARFEQVQTTGRGRGRHGVILAVNSGRKRSSFSEDKLKSDLTGTAGWTLYQLDFPIPADAGTLKPEIGFGPATTGSLSVDSVRLQLFPAEKKE